MHFGSCCLVISSLNWIRIEEPITSTKGSQAKGTQKKIRNETKEQAKIEVACHLLNVWLNVCRSSSCFDQTINYFGSFFFIRSLLASTEEPNQFEVVFSLEIIQIRTID